MRNHVFGHPTKVHGGENDGLVLETASRTWCYGHARQSIIPFTGVVSTTGQPLFHTHGSAMIIPIGSLVRYLPSNGFPPSGIAR
jgi:hypothetical protein